MSIKTVLFDLDGTLLPMDMDAFIKAYFGGLVKHLAPHGYDPELLPRGIWAGTAAMVKNDGSAVNEQVFWNTFASIFGDRVREDIPLFEDYYRTQFDHVRAACGYTPHARRIIDLLHDKGTRTVLATNPLFPAIATQKRMGWVDLSPDDFSLVTTYENSRFCKPDPNYYRDILDTLKLDPHDCLMVGNDVDEDMIATTLGMRVFLLSDCLINKSNIDIDRFPHGSFDTLERYLQEIL